MTSIAIKTDLRHLFGPIRDQGQRPTCLALAASDMHAAQRGKWLPLSCEYVFFHAQRRAGRPPTTGALLPAMLSALRYDGQPAESGWPYLATLPADLAHWNPPPGVAPIFRRAGEARACTIDTIIAQLDRGVAVLVLMYLSPSFYHPGRNGIIDEAPGESPDLSLCHAMAAACSLDAQ